MAKLFPRVLDPNTKSHGEGRLFASLEHQLSDEWVVFHGIPRLTNERGQRQEGEADFIVAHPDCGILVVEVKGGRITFDSHTRRLTSHNRHGSHDIGDPFKQAADNKGWLIRFLRDKPDWLRRPVIFGYAVAFLNR